MKIPFQNALRARVSGMSPLSPRALSAPLRWSLIVTLVATAAALLWPDRSVVVDSAAPQGSPAEPQHRAPDGTLSPLPRAPADELPQANGLASLSSPAASGAAPTFDPFAGVALPPPPAPGTPPPTVVVASPPPAPPAMTYRFAGRVTGPDGTKQVFLARGDALVAVSKGVMLDGGYVVESVDEDAVVLVFPDLRARVSIPAGSASQ